MRRKISLFILVAFIAALVTFNHGCSQPGALDSGDIEGGLNFDLSDPKLKERLGEDDGYAFAILYGADIHGSLETCG